MKAPPASSDPWRGAATIALVLVLLGAALLRWRLLDVPLERDEGEYAYGGQLVLAGGAPYLGLYNMKLPGIYLAYAAVLAACGETARGIHLGLLAASLASGALCFALVRRRAGSAAALVAAALLAVLAAGGAVLGAWANAEHFVLPFALAGLWLLDGAAEEAGARAGTVRLLAAGAALSCAVLVKQHAAAFVLCALAWLVVPPGALGVARRETARRLALLALGAVPPVLAVSAWLGSKGALERAFFWTFTYARKYVDQVPLEHAPAALWHGARPVLSAAPLAWALAGAGLVLCCASPRRHARLLALALCSFLAIAPGFFFREHYFVLLLPAGAALAGTAAAAAGRFAAGTAPAAAALAWGLGLVAAGDALWRGRALYFERTPEEIVRRTYAYNPFGDSPAIGALVAELCPPDGSVAILGSEPQILFYARRRSATGYVYMYPLMEAHEHARTMQRELIAELEAARPEVLVQVNVPGSWLFRPGVSPTEVLRWSNEFARGYELVALWEIGLDGSTLHQGAQLARLTRRPEVSVEVLRREAAGRDAR